jgi:hypothetical protein
MDERKKKFIAYSEVADQLEEIREKIVDLVDKRSKIVEDIYNNYGPGPFSYNGIVLTVSKRTNRLNGKDTYFFKSPSYTEIDEV